MGGALSRRASTCPCSGSWRFRSHLHVDGHIFRIGLWQWRRKSGHDPPQRKAPCKSSRTTSGESIMARGIGLITLVVDDYDEAIAWYTNVLGFSVESDTK